MTTVGQRVARARKRKGLTQAALAAAVGRSASWMAKVEGGFAALDRRSVIDRIAQALDVEVTELTGQPYRAESPSMDSGHRAIPALRLALQRASLPTFAALGMPSRALADLRAEVEAAEVLRQAANFSPLAELPPPLIEDLLVARRNAIGSEIDDAALLLVRACHIARVTANLTGHHDLAWMALERKLQAADSVGSPEVTAAAAWDLCGVWLHAGALKEARNAAVAALDLLDGYMGSASPQIRHMWGALHLRAAVANSRLWSAPEAHAHIEESRRVAPEFGNTWQTQFNRTNLLIHEVEIAVELGRPLDAAPSSSAINLGNLDSRERISHFWMCEARGLAMNNKASESLEALLNAERVAGAHVLNRPMVRALVDDLILKARRKIHPELARITHLVHNA